MNVENLKEPDNVNKISLSPLKVTWALGLITAFLVVMDIIRLYFKNKKPELTTVNDAFDRFIKLTGEYNLPTLFSAFLLLGAGLLLFLIFTGTHTKKYRYHWLFLGLVFVFLSLDESLMIHEEVSKFIRRNMTVEGSIHYGTWSVPYLIVSALVGFTFLKFVLQLPPKSKVLFIVSGAVYVIGAAGFELAEGYFFLHLGEESFLYRLTHWSQEVIEMIGIILFIYGLLDYIEKKDYHIIFKSKPIK